MLGLGIRLQAATLTSGFDDYLIDHWQTEHGLPDNSATAMAQSVEGYLWFGTLDGIVRFDGTHFRSFRPENTRGEPPSLGLPSASVFNLHLDAQQRLWVSTQRGLVIARDHTWTPLTPNDGWTGDLVRTFSENAGVLCLTTFNGKVFRAHQNTLIQLPPPAPGSDAGYFGHVDPQGSLWVARDRTCAVWQTNRWTFPAWSTEATEGLRCAGTGRAGELILVNSNAVLRVDQGQIRSRTPLERPVHDAWQLFEDSQTNLWITSSRHGLYRIDTRGRVRQLTTAQGLTQDALRFVFEDRTRHLWVGTSGGGLMRFRKRQIQNWGKEQGLHEPNLKAIVEEAPGRFLLGTYGGGLVRLQNQRATRVTDPGNTPLPQYVQCLVTDRRGRTWMGSHDASLTVGSNGRWTRAFPDYFAQTPVQALLEDSTGTLWIGHDQAISSLTTDRLDTPPQPRPGTRGLIRAFAENPVTREIWVGTTEGLFQRTPEGWIECLGPDHQPCVEISCLRFQTNGCLWTSSSHLGLARWRPSDRTWAVLGTTNGIPSNRISGIVDDGLGYWWFASNHGLIRTAIHELEAAADAALAGKPFALRACSFDRADGMASQECATTSPNSTLRDGSGRLWFATLRGAATLDPSRLTLQTNPPSPSFVQIQFLGHDGPLRQPRPARAGSTVVIPTDAHDITVEWTAFTFTSPEKTRFRYRLTRSDEQEPWIDSGTRNDVTLDQLGPGRWKLEVCAAGNGTDWSPPTEALVLQVNPRVWQRIWFGLTLALVVLGVTAVLVWQTGRAKLKASVDRTLTEQKQVEERLIASQDQIRRVLDTLPAAAYACDPLGQLTYFNRHAALLWGRVPRLGHPDDRFCGSLRLFALDGAAIPHDQSWTAIALAQQRSTTAEAVIERPGGRRRIVQANANPLIDSSGRLIGAVSVLMDITEDKNARETLAASEILLRQLIQHTPAAVAMFDLEMRYLHASDRWLSDYHLEGVNILGRSHYEVFPNMPGRWKEVHRKALAGAIERVEEDLYVHPDGSREWIQWEVRPWKKAGNVIGGVVIFTQFVTARRLAEQRIRDQLDELQRWHRATLGREDRVQQLKREVNELALRLGIQPPYSSQNPDPGVRVNGSTAVHAPTQPRA